MELAGTVWSNGGWSEYIIRRGDSIIQRSGMVYRSNASARRAMIKAATILNAD